MRWKTRHELKQSEERRAKAVEDAKQKRLEALKRKYRPIAEKVSLNWAVIQLFWREGKLTQADIASILDTDEDTINFEIGIARQNAR